MAFRLTRGAAGAARVRPAICARILPSLSVSSSGRRSTSSVPIPDPKKKAQSVLDSLPGNSLISKTAILSSTAGVAIYALSNEYYVVNEETVVAFCLLSIWTAVFKYGGPMYKEWADGQVNKMRNILNTARVGHTEAVKNRIESVKQFSSVVDITKTLFEISKETAQLEAKAYELEQKTALASEAKAVLDSWVRYEGQVKIREQKELSETVISKIQKELENPKVLQQILQQSVGDVERILQSKPQKV
ncbi:ATP synthase subunit 4, mitochondrial [Golovinomyces cichoracearum]|uniref:ATP synthase subunit 4 n=1 Tax=Golovinomyces cichoracearum TaxID=62708 RepID=A0A420IFL7_9PEZI|nr:ATP synthase subunit 4, mitochondrial [Golovinomyces cichoracearum]